MFLSKTNFFRSNSLVARFVTLYMLSTLSIVIILGVLFYKKMASIKFIFTAEQLDQIYHVCLEGILASSVVWLFGALVLGYLVARCGVKKINAFQQHINKISVDTLHRRVKPNDWPEELQLLVHSFNKMLDRIELSFSQLQKFSQDIAHELRTPINNLMGVTEITLSRPQTTSVYRETLITQMSQFTYLKRLIEGLLFLAKAENNELTLNKEIFSAKKVVEEVFAFFQVVADEKDVCLNCVGDFQINADIILIKRILINLISNSLRHTGSHGEITVNLSTKDKLQYIQVKDTGEGIAKEHLSKVFDRCYRTDSSRANHTGGLGLGLAIVGSIVDLHQGHIEITSTIGQSTTVLIKLPTGYGSN